MVCRVAVIACLLLALVSSWAQAQPESAETPEPTLAPGRGPLSSPPAADYADDSEYPMQSDWEAPGGGFLPPMGYDYFFRPWYGRVEALFLQRTNSTTGQTIVQSSGGGTPLIATGDFSFPMVAGPRLFLGKRIDVCSAIESTYFGTQFWESKIPVADPGNLDLAGALGQAATDFHQADIMSVAYGSQVQNIDLNYARLGENSAVFAGFRYLGWSERLTIAAVKNTDYSRYDLNVHNNLVGGQVGARASGYGQYFDWELAGKTGLFGNSAGQRQTLRDANNTVNFRGVNSSGSSLSFVGEVTLSATRRLNRNWQLRGGYNIMLITGLALAPNQLDFTNLANSGTGFDRSGTVFLHGVSIGIDAQW